MRRDSNRPESQKIDPVLVRVLRKPNFYSNWIELTAKRISRDHDFKSYFQVPDDSSWIFTFGPKLLNEGRTLKKWNKSSLHWGRVDDFTMLVNGEGDDITNPIFWARSLLLVVPKLTLLFSLSGHNLQKTQLILMELELMWTNFKNAFSPIHFFTLVNQLVSYQRHHRKWGVGIAMR